MRGTYEAFILVKVKDGRQYVCALNRRRREKEPSDRLRWRESQEFLDHSVIWN